MVEVKQVRLVLLLKRPSEGGAKRVIIITGIQVIRLWGKSKTMERMERVTVRKTSPANSDAWEAGCLSSLLLRRSNSYRATSIANLISGLVLPKGWRRNDASRVSDVDSGDARAPRGRLQFSLCFVVPSWSLALSFLELQKLEPKSTGKGDKKGVEVSEEQVDRIREELSCAICLGFVLGQYHFLWTQQRKFLCKHRPAWNTIQLLFPKEVEARKAEGALNGGEAEHQSSDGEFEVMALEVSKFSYTSSRDKPESLTSPGSK
ncbi:hypothetical protein HAX54_001751 [Datura stramonium]|uniref:Uncharacterized protein n=1 Tax=Datura stramonium TaxID=4076 RepID=A0ABS8RSQ7_DATST|nr:hypothetical protein [Datura stramonium]